jgi:hypothetical protein
MDQISYSATNIHTLTINNLTNVILTIHYKPNKIHIQIITEPENMCYTHSVDRKRQATHATRRVAEIRWPGRHLEAPSHDFSFRLLKSECSAAFPVRTPKIIRHCRNISKCCWLRPLKSAVLTSRWPVVRKGDLSLCRSTDLSAFTIH